MRNIGARHSASAFIDQPKEKNKIINQDPHEFSVNTNKNEYPNGSAKDYMLQNEVAMVTGASHFPQLHRCTATSKVKLYDNKVGHIAEGISTGHFRQTVFQGCPALGIGFGRIPTARSS